MTADQTLARIVDDTYDTLMGQSPLEATLLGDHRFDAVVPDVSPAGLAAGRQAVTTLQRRLSQIDQEALSTADRVTYDVAGHVTAQALHELDDCYVQSAAGPMTSGAAIGSAASAVLAGMPKQVLGTQAHADDYVERCRAIPGWLRHAEDQLRIGMRTGCVPPVRLVAATVRQIDRYLASDDRDPLLIDPPPGHSDPRRWRARLNDVLESTVRPAMRRHRTTLAGPVALAARPDDHVGLCRLPAGSQRYRAAVALHTTLDHDPEYHHQLGLDLIDALADEYAELGGRALGTTDVDEIFARLRDDPALRFATSDEIGDTASTALRRAVDAMDDWFVDQPSIGCEVRAIPEVEAPESTLGYYQPPALDGSRPGTYYVNTSDPEQRPRFEAEALAFHESVPGHHTQIATAMQLALPTLQRVVYVTAHAEGWGLYAERLADEMGLYSDDVARLGMLSFDSWRACRLVVDTGMHALGWSRDRAVAFMRANSPQALRNIDNEVDRYIGWPGQALAYMAGRTHIVALRDRARAALGPHFDIAAFHAVVLGHAAVPLTTLERLVDDWVAAQTGSAVTTQTASSVE
ncbi:hypothetical protein BH23ACT10_BH23ACT10_16830 [soil metagenome]